ARLQAVEDARALEAIVVGDRAGHRGLLVGHPRPFGAPARLLPGDEIIGSGCGRGSSAGPPKTESLRASSTAEKASVAGSSWVFDFFAITLYNSHVGWLRLRRPRELSWTGGPFGSPDHLGKKRFKCPPRPRPIAAAL